MKKTFLYSLLSAGLLLMACSGPKQVLKPVQADPSLALKARDHFLRGVYFQGEERNNEALVEFYQALQYDSTSAAIYTAIAENHMKLSHFESAEILLRKALKLSPGNEQAMRLLAESYLRTGQDDKAIETFRANLIKNPADDESRQYLMLLYEKNGDLANLARQTEELIELYGQDKHLQQRLADLYIKQKNYSKAQHYLKKLAQNDSGNAQIFYMIGQIYDQQNQPDSATALYHRTLEIDPFHQGALDRLTRRFRLAQNWQGVIDLYQPLLQADSTNRPARVLIAESFYYLEEFDQARDYLQPLLDVPEPDLPIIELMGRIEFEAKNLNRAESLFRQIIERDKQNKFAYLFLAFALSDMDSLDRAGQVFKEALLELPLDATIWSFYGMNLQQREQYTPAIEAYYKTLQLDSMNVNALSNLPVVFETVGRIERSDSLYEIAIRRLPENDLLLNNFSYSLSERDLRMQDALKMASKAVAAQPENAAYLDTIGWIYFKLGRYEEAEQYIRKSIQIREDSAVVLEHLGDVYAAMGKLDHARKYWQQAYELDQNNQELLKKMELNR